MKRDRKAQICRILLRYTYRNHLDEFRQFEDDFISIAAFTGYLRWVPDRAMMIGYTKSDPEILNKTRTSNVQLAINADGTEWTFKNVFDLAYFLDHNPDIALHLQYYPKAK